MTRDEIIRMAREAGLQVAADYDYRGSFEKLTFPEREEFLKLLHFAALVISRHVKETRVKPTASQRETFQQLAYQHGGIGGLCGTEFEFAALVAQHEREECAKIAEEWSARGVAAAIRARGEKS